MGVTRLFYRRERYSMVRADELESWLKVGKERGASFVVIVHDLVDYTDFPSYALPHESLEDIIEVYDNENDMMHVSEVFSLTGKYTIEEQLDTERAWFID